MTYGRQQQVANITTKEETGIKSDHGLGPQEFFQKSLPLAGVLILHRHRQCLPCSNKDSEVFSSRQGGVNEVPKEHLEMLGQNRDDNRPELTALRFVDGYGVGQIQFRDVIAFIVNRPPIRKKRNHTCQFLVVDFLNDPDVAVEHSEVVIVSPDE